LAIYEDIIKNHSAKFVPGGAAQNTARGAQYILPPSSVVYIGCIGSDHYGDQLLHAVHKAGLHVEYRRDESQPTGRCAVIITGHDRSLVTDLAAANCYKVEHLKQHWSLVQSAQIFYVGGYHLTVCPEAIEELGKEAVRDNKVFALSLSAPFIPAVFKSQLAAVMGYCDYLFGNEAEAGVYAESQGWSKGLKMEEIVMKIANLEGKVNEKRKRVVVITRGKEDTFVGVQGEEKVKEYSVERIDEKEIADTNGAGDAFAGGFLAGLVEGKDLDTCVKMASWLAKLSLTQTGADYPHPKQVYSGN